MGRPRLFRVGSGQSITRRKPTQRRRNQLFDPWSRFVVCRQREPKMADAAHGGQLRVGAEAAAWALLLPIYRRFLLGLLGFGGLIS